MSELLLDAAGRRRSPATLPDFHAGRAPRNKGDPLPREGGSGESVVLLGASRVEKRPPQFRD